MQYYIEKKTCKAILSEFVIGGVQHSILRHNKDRVNSSHHCLLAAF